MRHAIRTGASILALTLAAGGALAQQPLSVRRDGAVVELTGACDASAIALVPGSSPPRYLVLVDEPPEMLAYTAGGSEPVGITGDITGILTRDNGTLEAMRPANGRSIVRRGDEADLEGAAWLGDRLYIIASHGRNSSGARRPRRERLVALTVTQRPDGVTIADTGTRYPHLLRDLAELPLLRAAIDTGDTTIERLMPERAGLNIEGLAAGRDGTSLLLGLRNPMAPGGFAIVVQLLNPAELRPEPDGPRARFGEPILLDLGGRAIRSMEWVPERQLYLIVAGLSGQGSAFALYSWGGPGTAAPPQRIDKDDTFSNDGADPFRPEGLAVEPDGNRVILVSDDGDRRPAGVQGCGSRFRLMRLALE